MQDLIGTGYTLLRLDDSHDASALEQSFRALRAPLQVLNIGDRKARELYGHDLLLLRPDLHVAWRGNEPPEDPRALAKLVTGSR